MFRQFLSPDPTIFWQLDQKLDPTKNPDSDPNPCPKGLRLLILSCYFIWYIQYTVHTLSLSYWKINWSWDHAYNFEVTNRLLDDSHSLYIIRHLHHFKPFQISRPLISKFLSAIFKCMILNKFLNRGTVTLINYNRLLE